MSGAVCLAFWILSLAFPIVAQTRQPAPPQPVRSVSTYDPAAQPGLYHETWYDAMLKQFNPDNLDWGQWLDERTQELLEQTAANPYFKYSLVTTLLLVLLTVALTKALIDNSRMKWLAQERYNDLRRHDQASRQAAREAIQRYNAHMEKCNRVVEAEMTGQHAMSGSAAPETAPGSNLTLDEALIALADSKRELVSTAAKLDRSNSVVGELSMRIHEVQAGGNGSVHGGASMPDLVKQINEVREQLYHERERNKRLKGV